jgi:hypothetical protein
LHAELEQAPNGNHLVIHEHRLMEAEVGEASQLVLAHPQAVIETQASTWELVLEVEEVLPLELVPEEALALLPVQVRMHEAEVVASSAWVLVPKRKCEVGGVASSAFELGEELELVLVLVQALERWQHM